jgi:hypothetical protein
MVANGPPNENAFSCIIYSPTTENWLPMLRLISTRTPRFLAGNVHYPASRLSETGSVWHRSHRSPDRRSLVRHAFWAERLLPFARVGAAGEV